MIDSPKPWTRTTLEKYVAEIDADIDEVVSEMGGFDGFRKTLRDKKQIEDPGKIRLASTIVEQIRGRDLVAMSITEVMDRTKGPFNLALFDIMLRYGGKEYLAHIPAINDPYVSYGNYQHTKYSVGGRIKESSEAGADAADRVFTGGKILKDANGKSVNIENFPIELHHKAAYLLIVNNIASAISRMPETFGYVEIETVKVSDKKGKTVLKQIEKPRVSHPVSVLENCFRKKEAFAMDILLQYVAAAHNNPKHSYEGLLYWLADYEKLGSKAGDDLGMYIEKATARANAERQKVNNHAIKQAGAVMLASAR
jgi:hypothetical protein